MNPIGTLDKPVNNDVLYEVVNGQRLELPPMGAFETDIASILLFYLWQFAKKHGLGKAVGEMLFLLDRIKDLQRRPDVAFVSYKRWPKGRRVPRTNAWEVVPNLAVEVVSASNTADEILTKIREYFEVGVELVWVIYPTEEMVYVYQSPTQIHILKRTQELEGGTILPGFRLPLADLFEEEATDQEGA